MMVGTARCAVSRACGKRVASLPLGSDYVPRFVICDECLAELIECSAFYFSARSVH